MAVLLLLGPAREAAGVKEEVVTEGTVGEVIAAACQRHGADFERIVAASRVWLNGAETGDDQVVGSADEVAVVPPVSGGCSSP
jgi:molybdopterin converting factor small subunit